MTESTRSLVLKLVEDNQGIEFSTLEFHHEQLRTSTTKKTLEDLQTRGSLAKTVGVMLAFLVELSVAPDARSSSNEPYLERLSALKKRSATHNVQLMFGEHVDGTQMAELLVTISKPLATLNAELLSPTDIAVHLNGRNATNEDCNRIIQSLVGDEYQQVQTVSAKHRAPESSHRFAHRWVGKFKLLLSFASEE